MTAVMVFSITPVMAEPIQAQAEETPSTTKTIAGLGTSVMKDPTAPTSDTDAWKGSYVYYGNYDADGDETAEPVKYRVLDANTTDYSADGTTQTMLLDCDSILYSTPFDGESPHSNVWKDSPIYTSLNGDGFLNKEGVFTTAEKNAIAKSNVASHALTTDSKTGVNVASGTQSNFANYVALTGEQIFLLDAEDVSNGAYGYSITEECENRKKTGSLSEYWWLRSADSNDYDRAGYVGRFGNFIITSVAYAPPGVSPAFNVNLSSVMFSSVISGTAGETGAEYKLTLLDSDMTIAANGDATRYGKTVTIPYRISGNNSGNATQVSVLVLDKEYTAGNTNGATVLDYQKLNVENFSTSGTGTYTLPDSLANERMGLDYYVYIIAEDVNGEKETNYASTPVAISWAAPVVKQMNFGTQGIIDPAVPNSANDAWKGCYVYYGNYDAGNDGTAEPVKYRVLDANTTKFGGTTMLLDCDSILYYMPFDNDSTANADGKNANDWSISDVKSSLNGDGFLNKAGVFTTAEKNAISASTVATHALTTNSATGVNVAGWTQGVFANYVALTGEQIFLLDAEDVSNGAYGYSMTDGVTENRKKTGSSAATWWLRSAVYTNDNYAGCVGDDGSIYSDYVIDDDPGVSPALNLNLSSVIFSSASAVSKSSALGSGSAEIGTTSNTQWKLTLKDDEKSVKLTQGRSVTKASDGTTITVPYTYTDKENATESEKVNQISVMITDKAYDAEKAANAQEAQILYYGALQNIKNAEGTASTVAEASAGTGTFALPSGLTGTLGTDYHIYLLAEHVNADNSTDYASEPKEVTAILDEVDTVTVPSIDTPIAEQPFEGEITISSTGVAEKATLTWKKDDTEATGNAEWKTTYQAYVTLTAADGYALVDATGNKASVTLNGQPVDTENITLNADGTLTVYCGEYTTATRKTEGATAPEVPTQFANYYTADNVLSSTELGTIAKETLEGTTQPNPEEMEVEWNIANEGGAAYDATPTATNTFKWIVKESEYADYDKDAAVLEGTVTIQNKDYTPVTITGEDVTVTYDGKDTLDVSQYFTIDENAGIPTYEMLDTSTGTGTLEGTTLTMTTLGTFVIKVSTPINGVYNKGEHTLTITVNKADNTPNMPESTMNTVYTNETVGKVTLPEGWVWQDSDKTKALEVGKAVTATAIYNGADKGKYVTESVEVSITRQACTHTWDAGVVTKEATATEKGEKTYTCTVCKETKTEEVSALGAPKVGTKDTSDDGKATYKVTTSDVTNGTVTYVAPTDAKATTVTIPDTVVVDGVTYKVTAIEKNAFKNNKYIKKVIIGNNIITIGDNAFYGCKKLKTVKFGKNVKTIGNKAFYKCSALTKITIPSKVKTIGKSAFYGCKKLKTVTIGKSVTKIGAKAFYGCSKIKTLTIKSSKLTTKKIGSKAFSKTPKSMTVKVPKKKFKAYKSMLIKRGVNKKAKFKKN